MGVRGSSKDGEYRAVGGLSHALTARQAVGGGRAKVGARAVFPTFETPSAIYIFGFCHPITRT